MIPTSATALKGISYYHTGGHCQTLYSPTELTELQEQVQKLSKDKTPYFILGKGSNSLLSDELWPGAVLNLQGLQGMSRDGNTLTCEAGVDNSVLAKTALYNRLAGVAWMYRLPGSLGATVRMNARCYGGEISQVVTKVTALNPKGEWLTFETQANDRSVFKSYKNTIFMTNSLLVAKVQLSLNPGLHDEIEAKMLACESDRLGQHQFDFPTCGCVFKNNYADEVSVSSGMLLEFAGAKSLQNGNACVSPYHANFVYNQGSNSREILELTFKMRELVWQEYGVWLEYEMEVLGHLPDDLKKKLNEKRTPKYKAEKLALVRKAFQERFQYKKPEP